MKHLIIVICFICFHGFSFAQLNCFSGYKFTSSVLADGRTIYKRTIERRPKCMDCPAGVQYVDSVCNTIASFVVGNSPKVFVAAGYKLTDFAEGKISIYKSVYERSQNKLSYNFIKGKGFIISEIKDTDLSFLHPGDSIHISNQNGLLHFRNGKLLNTYKIIPQKVNIRYNTNQQIMAYYSDYLKTFFFVKENYGNHILFKYYQPVAQHEFPDSSDENNWLKTLILQ